MKYSSVVAGLLIAVAPSALAAPSRGFDVVVRDVGQSAAAAPAQLDKRILDNPPPVKEKRPQGGKTPKVSGPKGGIADGQVGADLANGIVSIIDWVTSKFQHDKDSENVWVGNLLKELMAKNPTKNVLIYHDQKSKMQLQGSQHVHHELKISFGKTKGYEVHVFDKGWFELHGDGGYLNVGYGGCWKGNNYHVDFDTRTQCPYK